MKLTAMQNSATNMVSTAGFIVVSCGYLCRFRQGPDQRNNPAEQSPAQEEIEDENRGGIVLPTRRRNNRWEKIGDEEKDERIPSWLCFPFLRVR